MKKVLFYTGLMPMMALVAVYLYVGIYVLTYGEMCCNPELMNERLFQFITYGFIGAMAVALVGTLLFLVDCFTQWQLFGSKNKRWIVAGVLLLFFAVVWLDPGMCLTWFAD